MRVVIAVLALLCGLAYAVKEPPGTTCSTSAECTDEEFPYCVTISPAGSGEDRKECRECLRNADSSEGDSMCDCDFDEYCSGKPGDAGLCFPFEQEGNDCRPVQDMSNDKIKKEWKCADLFSSNGATRPNHIGGCIESSCTFCVPGQSCNGGRKENRICSTAGSYEGTRVGLAWAESEYHTNPSAVWQAIIFAFFIFLLVCQLAQCVITIMNPAVLAGGDSGGGGGGKAGGQEQY